MFRADWEAGDGGLTVGFGATKQKRGGQFGGRPKAFVARVRVLVALAPARSLKRGNVWLVGRWCTDGDDERSFQRDALRRLAVPTMLGRWVERASASQAGW